jgi:hypothetical protein
MSLPVYQIKLCKIEEPWPLDGKPYGMIVQIFPDARTLLGVLFQTNQTWAQLDEEGQVLVLDQRQVAEAIKEASTQRCVDAIEDTNDFIASLICEDKEINFSSFRFPSRPLRPHISVPALGSLSIAPPRPSQL